MVRFFILVNTILIKKMRTYVRKNLFLLCLMANMVGELSLMFLESLI
ncbi:hypothetical protein N040_11205 [Serratia marcescens EGD-HP20]|nr:hypothetical protein N040_11205 [Serratia marcescens EGD-HP20]